MSSVFTSFEAYATTKGNALNVNWSFDASFVTDVNNGDSNPDFLYIYITDFSNITTGMSSPVVVPLFQDNGNLTTQFDISSGTPGMTFDIVNGTEYQVMGQMVYTNSSNTIVTSNSTQSIIMCSTIPQVPSNFTVTPYNDSFGIKLFDASGASPTPISKFDGYGRLRGIFVNYSDGAKMFSTFIPNDASNSIYSDEQIIDVSMNSYEVTIASYNYNTAEASNNTTVSWGGRSGITTTKNVTIDGRPGPVTSLKVYETMADASAVDQPTYTSVSNKITWDEPIIGASNELIDEYKIYRDNVEIATVLDSSFSYIDTSGGELVVGEEYSYTVAAVNEYGEGPKAAAKEITGVIFPRQTTLDIDASGSNGMAMEVTNVDNGFPLANYRWDFSYNGVNTGYESENPLTVDVSYGVTYYIQSSTDVSSVNMPSVSYTTGYTTDVSFIPYNPIIPDPTDVEVTPLDEYSIPNSQIKVSWINSNTSSVGFTGDLSYNLEFKLTGSPDASYALASSGPAIDASSSAVTLTTPDITLGSSYEFRVKNILTGTGSHAGKTANSKHVESEQVVPFGLPGNVQSLALSNPTTTDMSYSFVAPSSTGGLPIARYFSELRILNDGSDNFVADTSGNDMSGNLATLFGQALKSGSQYKLIVNAVVDGSYNVVGESFNGQPEFETEFTVPTGLNSPEVVNAEDGQLLQGIKITWDASAIDASNATYTIYANGAAASNPLATDLSGTFFIDASATIGSVHSYQVVPVVYDVSANYVPNVTPVPSDTIERIGYPVQPTGLTITDRTIDSVDFSWNASTGGSGNDASLNYLWMLTDSGSNVDASGVTTSLNASASGLDSAETYTLTVQAGVVNPEDDLSYYNPDSIPDENFTLYNDPSAAQIQYVYSSNNALLINLVDAVDVSGLTFSNYKIDVATDASFNNGVTGSPFTGSVSEFYVSGLTNGTTYYIRAYNVYNDGEEDVESPVSATVTGVPEISPNKPANVSADTEEQGSITVYWDIDTNDSTINRYALNYGTDPSNLIPENMTFELLSDFSSNATQYYRKITGLTSGTTYYANVVAGIDQGGSTAVSQPSTTVEAVPYSVPSVPRNFANYPSTTSILSEWSAPSDNGGAGGSNSQLYYQLQIDVCANFTAPLNETEIEDLSFNSTSLPSNTYNARVRAFFYVQRNTENVAASAWVYQYGIKTQEGPTEPTINVTAQNSLGADGSQKGRTVLIDYTIDPSFGATLTLKRQAYDPSGNTALDNAYIEIDSSNVPIGTSSGQFVDNELNGGADNFLNGNMMQYQLDVSYDVIGGSDPLHTITAASKVAPYSKPIPVDASGNAIDLSACIVPIGMSNGEYSSFELKINKNGSDINSLVAVGLLDVSGTVYVVEESNPVIAYDNVQVDGKIAANQYGTTIVNYGVGNLVDNTMAILSNAGGAQICKQPEGGSFGNN